MASYRRLLHRVSVGQLLEVYSWARTTEALSLSEPLRLLHPSQGKENQLLQVSKTKSVSGFKATLTTWQYAWSLPNTDFMRPVSPVCSSLYAVCASGKTTHVRQTQPAHSHTVSMIFHFSNESSHAQHLPRYPFQYYEQKSSISATKNGYDKRWWTSWQFMPTIYNLSTFRTLTQKISLAFWTNFSTERVNKISQLNWTELKACVVITWNLFTG
jgi:hypothetical protein